MQSKWTAPRRPARQVGRRPPGAVKGGHCLLQPVRATGFFADHRRIMAGMRAQRRLCPLGDSKTLGGDPYLTGLVTRLIAASDVRPADGYLDNRHAVTRDDDDDDAAMHGKTGGAIDEDIIARGTDVTFHFLRAGGPAPSDRPLGRRRR